MAWVRIERVGRIAAATSVFEAIEDKTVRVSGQVGGMLSVLAGLRRTLTKQERIELELNRDSRGFYELLFGTDTLNDEPGLVRDSLASRYPGTLVVTGSFRNEALAQRALQIDVRFFSGDQGSLRVPLDLIASALSPCQSVRMELYPIVNDKELRQWRATSRNEIAKLKKEKSDRGFKAMFVRGGTSIDVEERRRQEVLLREFEAYGYDDDDSVPGWRCVLRSNPGGLVKDIAALLHSDTSQPAGFASEPAEHQKRLISVRKAVHGIMSPSEAALLFALPTESLPGLPVITLPETSSASVSLRNADTIHLGLGERFNEAVELAVPDLREHVLICGTTGSGKSTTAMRLVQELMSRGCRTTVVAPAKGTEYECLFNGGVIALGDSGDSGLRFNPLRVPSGQTLARHLDGVKAAFTAAFSMEGPLPQLFERVLYRAYEGAGWDLATGVNTACLPASSAGPGDEPPAPTLSDMLRLVPSIALEAGYGPEITQNVQGALSVRLRSLCTGFKGRMLNTRQELGLDRILNGDALLRLDDLGNDEEKAFVMSMILLRLESDRKSAGETPSTGNPKHVLVIEEAHRLLRNVAKSTGEFSSNTQAKAIEAFASLLAELRAYGEGVIIVEQSPSELVPAVLKNSNTKIVHRLVERTESTVAAGALGMSEKDASALVALRAGEALFMTKGMPRPALIKVQHGSES